MRRIIAGPFGIPTPMKFQVWARVDDLPRNMRKEVEGCMRKHREYRKLSLKMKLEARRQLLERKVPLA